MGRRQRSRALSRPEFGRERWRQEYPSPRYGRLAEGDQGLYSGATSTPEFDAQTGFLITLGIDGDLRAWNTQGDGQLVWKRQLYEEFDVPKRPRVGRSGHRDYGFTSSPLVLGDWVIVEVGATTGNLIALDRRTGETRWQSQNKSPAGHNGGPVPITVEGVACVAIHTFDGLHVARLDRGREGETVATYPWKTDFANNIASLTVAGDSVLMTSHYNQERTARLKVSLRGASVLWEAKVASKVCSPVVLGEHVYFAWEQVHCLDFATGKLLWRGERTGDPGSCLGTSDGRLIVWCGSGKLLLVDSAARSPAALEDSGRARSPLTNRRLAARDACRRESALQRPVGQSGLPHPWHAEKVGPDRLAGPGLRVNATEPRATAGWPSSDCGVYPISTSQAALSCRAARPASRRCSRAGFRRPLASRRSIRVVSLSPWEMAGVRVE